MADSSPMQFRQATFELVSESLRREVERHGLTEAISRIAHDLAREFAQRNPRFDRNKFLMHAGIIGPAVTRR